MSTSWTDSKIDEVIEENTESMKMIENHSSDILVHEKIITLYVTECERSELKISLHLSLLDLSKICFMYEAFPKWIRLMIDMTVSVMI